MTQPTTAQLNAVIDKILAEWADKGKIIEGGWQTFVVTGGLLNAPEQQLKEMRKAYMLGAQHLYASMMAVMDEDREPTERDMKRMSLIHEELETFRRSLVN